jgi:drug/metabolite transporter (DMT)-like permease
MLHVFATIFLLGVAVTTGSQFSLLDFGWGGLSGIGLGIGMGGYYSGLGSSTSTVMAPTVAALSALLPFGYTAARGAAVGPIQILGVLTVVAGLILVTGGSASREHLRAGVPWGVLSGLGYFLGAIGFVEVADTGSWWPTVGQRATAGLLLFCAAVVLRVSLRPPSGQLWNAVFAGVTTGLVSLLYLAALGIDATVGVVAVSAFPAFTVMIGRTFFGDQVKPWQAAGIALVIIGVAAVSTG